jgi:hypothetical protein
MTQAAPSAGTSPFTLLSTVAMPDVPISIALNGNLAYVCTENSIVTVDVSNPASPAILSTTTTPIIQNSGDIHCSIQRGVLAVFADQTSTTIGNSPGFVALSLANPTSPQVIQATPINKRFFQEPVYIGNYAFVPTGAVTFLLWWYTGQDGDLLSIDLTDFTAPKLLGTLASPLVSDVYGGAHIVLGASQAASSLLYVGTSTATGGGNTDEAGNLGVGLLQAVDITNPAVPTVVGQLAVPETVYLPAPYVQGNVGVSIGNGGTDAAVETLAGRTVVVTFDLSNPRSPAVLSVTTTNLTPGPGGGGARIGSNLFLISGFDDQSGAYQLLLVDTTNPYKPVLTTYPFPVTVNGTAVAGNLLYFATQSGLQIYSIPGGTPAANSCPASVDVALILDLSTSFSAAVTNQVIASTNQFLNQLQFPTDRVAVVQTGSSATVTLPLSANKAAVSTALAGLLPSAGTNLGAAITAAQNELLGPLKNPSGAQTILIFSNGNDSAAPNKTATAQAAAAAKAAGIRILTIGYGSGASNLPALATSAADSRTALDAGALKPVTVLDATTATAVLNIDPLAAPGPRTCTIATGSQSIQMANALTVLPVTAATTSNVLNLQSLSPTSGTAGQTISVLLTGLPNGVSASGIRVTLTPVVAGSATQVLTASSVQAFGSSFAVGFQIPQGLRVPSPVSYLVSVSGMTPGNVPATAAFASANSLTLTIQQAPSIAKVVPPGGARKSAAPVRIFVGGISLANATVQASFGPDIQVGSGNPGEFGPVAVQGADSVTAFVRVASDASVGPRTVSLLVNSTLLTLDKAFNVTIEYGPLQPVKIVSVNPTQGLLATPFTLNVSGLPPGPIDPSAVTISLSSYTTTTEGTSTFSIGVEGQTRAQTVQTSSSGIGQITFIPSDDYLQGYGYNVSVAGSSDSYIPFASTNTVTMSILDATGPIVDSVYLAAGTPVTVLLHGKLTHFVQGQTTANFGPYISVGGAAAGTFGPVSVTGPYDASANLTVAATIPSYNNLYYQSFQAQTGSEIATGQATVFVPPGPPTPPVPEVWISPYWGNAGDTLQVSINGANTHFAAGSTVANLGPDISVGGAPAGQFGPVNVSDPVTATATITISPDAQTCNGIPGYAPTGQRFGRAKVAVPKTVRAAIRNSLGARSVGAAEGDSCWHDLTVQTGAEVVLDQSAFIVQPAPQPGFSMSSYYLYAGQTANPTFYLYYLTLQPNAKLNAGADIQVGGAPAGTFGPLTALGSDTATASISVAPTAQLGPRTLTLQNGGQTYTTDIEVTELGAVASISPPTSTVQVGSAVTLTIQTSGITLDQTASLGVWDANVLVTNSTVTSPNTMTVTLQVLNTAQEGPLTAIIQTQYGSTSQFTLFTVVNNAPHIVSVSPSWAGPGSTVITATVANLTLVAGQVTASLGPGISVSHSSLGAFGPVQVLSPTQLTFTAIVPASLPGAYRTLQLQIGNQVIAGGSIYVY